MSINKENLILIVMGLIIIGLFLLAMLNPPVADAACLTASTLL
ncbi:MAG: hypothetical protein VB084_02065 [Syntrophomonadaceae bacterium]|nr:hypothetical protein [Syntrophomonadaceae bacterium]